MRKDKGTSKGSGKAKKPKVRKETISDLTPLKSKAAAVKGGRGCRCGTTTTD